MKLSEYILLSKEERMSHIDLSSPCVLNPTNRNPDKCGILGFLAVEDDMGNWKKGHVERCHCCDHHSTNGWCINPRHMYIGTPSENKHDQPEEVLKESGRLLGLRKASDEARAKMSASAIAKYERRRVHSGDNSP